MKALNAALCTLSNDADAPMTAREHTYPYAWIGGSQRV
jgi:hypothetical protein